MSDAGAVLLDIEGTTTPVDFVYKVLFPYAHARIADYLGAHEDEAAVKEDVAGLRQEHERDVRAERHPPGWSDSSLAAATYARWLMDQDRKATALKSLQGKVWAEGYLKGELMGQVYEDVPRALVRWTKAGKGVAIFSSGSVLAQKLIFGHTPFGDLTPLPLGLLRYHHRAQGRGGELQADRGRPPLRARNGAVRLRCRGRARGGPRGRPRDRPRREIRDASHQPSPSARHYLRSAPLTTTLDVARLRAETPGCARVLHFNNAGSSLPPAPVLEAQLAHLRLEAEIGGYEAADQAASQVARAHAAVAALLKAKPSEIAVVENATRAFDMAFYAFPFRAGDRILTSEVEYASNYLAFLQVARRLGVVVEPIVSEPDGTISLPALRTALARDDRARLVALTHVPTNGGLVNPAAEVGAACREAGVPFLLDACQSAGQMPLDVEALGCDVLSATARKFLRGPRGVGFLYVRSSLIERLEPPFVDLHAATWTARDSYELRPDARRFENWEGNVAAEDRPRRRRRLRPRAGPSRHSRPHRRPRRSPAPRPRRAARRPRPRPGHLEVRHRDLRRRRS